MATGVTHGLAFFFFFAIMDIRIIGKIYIRSID